MAALVYVFVILIGAASVMFGLDLMHAPLRHPPNVPLGRAVSVASQTPAQQRLTKEADDRELTPIYPTKLASGAPQGETKAPAPDAARGSGPAAPVRSEGNTGETDGKAEPVATEPARAEEPAAPQPVAAKPAAPAPLQPQPQPKSASFASCNVQDCQAAYRSFRASDCTYQPMSGPRRACLVGDAKNQQVDQRPRPQKTVRAQNPRDDLREVERIVRRMTPDYGDDFPARVGAGRIVQDDEGRIYILRRSWR